MLPHRMDSSRAFAMEPMEYGPLLGKWRYSYCNRQSVLVLINFNCLSKTGAQTGHACSTTTAVNLFRSGNQTIVEKYNLEKMCESARRITEITTREKCPPHEEIYGPQAFDIPVGSNCFSCCVTFFLLAVDTLVGHYENMATFMQYFMVNLPSCRYSIFHVLTKIGVKDRMVRLNELSMVTHVKAAMEQHFGPSHQAGWDPAYCKPMWQAIRNHLLTGLSRDYNSALGLGHLYGMASQKPLQKEMIKIMSKDSTVPDNHPTILDYIFRWNRLCALYEGEDVPPHPASTSKSYMYWGTPAVFEPRRPTLPLDFVGADITRNEFFSGIPNVLRLQIVRFVNQEAMKLQKTKVPVSNFHENILRLKLFIQEAESLGLFPLVDDL